MRPESQGLCLVVHAYNPNTRETKAEGHEFQVSSCYIVGPYLKEHFIILRGKGEDSLLAVKHENPSAHKSSGTVRLLQSQWTEDRQVDLGARWPASLAHLASLELG